eukprot:jgi/Picre1/33157/NNA_008482.t1
MSDLRFAMICASNVNRSVAAHALLKEHGFDVESFGVGNSVKLPGLTVQQPNDMILMLRHMMQRDMGVKPRPQRWQNRTDKDGLFDVIVTFEKRVMDIVIADLQSKNGVHPCAVINMEVKDSASEAQVAAPHALKLCTMIADVGEDWERGN